MPYKINKSPCDDMHSSWLRFGVNNREQSNANTAVPPVNTCKLAWQAGHVTSAVCEKKTSRSVTFTKRIICAKTEH